jgi:hypothetical protein
MENQQFRETEARAGKVVIWGKRGYELAGFHNFERMFTSRK